MIQRLASLVRAAWPALLLACSHCASPLAHSVPRELDGALVRGAFVPPTSYEAYLRGELLLQQGRYAEAAAQLELATVAPQEDAFLLARLAYAQFRAGYDAEAEATLQQAARIDPCAEQVWLTRGELAQELRDYPAAERAFGKATACAPRSAQGELALARLLERTDRPAEALDVLARASARGGSESLRRALDRSLAAADRAALAHALSALGRQRAPDTISVTAAVKAALARGEPRLALRLRDQQPAPLPPALEAELLRQNGLRESLSALLAMRGADELGGHENTALLALEAGAYERAELEASRALVARESEAVRATRVRALLGLGLFRDALVELRHVATPALRRGLLLETLARSGAPALAKELAARPHEAPPAGGAQ